MRYKLEIQAYSSFVALLFVILVSARIVVGNKNFESVQISTPIDTVAISSKYSTDSLHINTATVSQLRRFGFSYYELYNIVSYRDAGGKIRSWQKLSTIYGIDTIKLSDKKDRILYDDIIVKDEKIARYYNYGKSYNKKEKITYKNKNKYISLYYTDSAELINNGIDAQVVDSLLYYRKNYIVKGKIKLDSLQMASTDNIGSILKPHIDKPKKTKILSKAIQIIELNQATTQELSKQKYIAEYSANQIVNYREKLGGYVSVMQLKEVYALKNNENIESIIKNLTIDKSKVKKININTIELSKLRKHPYSSETMCNILIRQRKSKQQINNIEEFQQIMSNVKYNKFLEEYLLFE